eukprot:COSAG05_NODE_1737_length_4164_cov_4.505781_1_plen_74_part_00
MSDRLDMKQASNRIRSKVLSILQSDVDTAKTKTADSHQDDDDDNYGDDGDDGDETNLVHVGVAAAAGISLANF